jgi:hypothetical protein
MVAVCPIYRLSVESGSFLSLPEGFGPIATNKIASRITIRLIVSIMQYPWRQSPADSVLARDRLAPGPHRREAVGGATQCKAQRHAGSGYERPSVVEFSKIPGCGYVRQGGTVAELPIGCLSVWCILGASLMPNLIIEQLVSIAPRHRA